MRSKILTVPRIGLFLLISFAVTGLHALFARNGLEIGVLFGINLATLFNIYLIIFIVERLLSDAKGNKKGMLAGIFVIKTTILLLAFIVGVHFVGDRVILSVINYTIQVFLLSIFLYFCLSKVDEVENR